MRFPVDLLAPIIMTSRFCRRRLRLSRRRHLRSAGQSVRPSSRSFVWHLLGRRLAMLTSIASASGKIIPSGGAKEVIQPFETGVVRAIHVRDGETVKAGQVLIELDPTMNEAERNHLHSDLVSAQLDIARLRAALKSDEDPVAGFHPAEDAPPLLVCHAAPAADQPDRKKFMQGHGA